MATTVDRSVSLPTFILERYINPIELSLALQESLEGTFRLPMAVEVSCISSNCPADADRRLRRLQSDTDFTYSGSVTLESAEPDDATIIAAALSYLSTRGLVHDSGMKDDPHIKTWTGQWFDVSFAVSFLVVAVAALTLTYRSSTFYSFTANATWF